MNWVYLDLDGTLTDPFEGITKSLLHSLLPWGISADDQTMRAWVGPPLRETYAALGLSETEGEAAVERFRDRYLEVGWSENVVFPGIPEALGTLRAAGWRLGVATSKPTEPAQRIVDHFGIGHHFEFVAGASLDKSRDAKADVIAWARSEFGAGEGWMVGDRRHDIIGGQAHGLDTVGVLWGYGGRAELEAAGATHLVSSPKDLAEVLVTARHA